MTHGHHALVIVNVTGKQEVDAVFVKNAFESITAYPADAAANHVLTIEGAMTRYDNPWCLGAVNTCEILSQEFKLLIGITKAADTMEVFDTTVFNWASVACAQIGFRIHVDKVDKTIVPGVPEVAETIRLLRRHTPVVLVAGEVCLAREAWHVGVADVVNFVRSTTVITVGVMVARTNHVGTDSSDRSDLIKELFKHTLIDIDTFLKQMSLVHVLITRNIILDLLLEPVVGISNVARVPHKLVSVNVLQQGLHSVSVVRAKRISSSSANCVRKAIFCTHQTHIDGNGEAEGSFITGRESSGESVGGDLGAVVAVSVADTVPIIP